MELIFEEEIIIILQSSHCRESDSLLIIDSIWNKNITVKKKINDHFRITFLLPDFLSKILYLPLYLFKKIIKLFEKTKQIFDPNGIFNPGKKVKGNIKYAMKHIKTHS